MTDLKKLKEVLENQQERGIQKGDYSRAVYVEKTDERGTYLSIDCEQIGFRFNKNGRFVGIFNFQQ